MGLSLTSRTAGAHPLEMVCAIWPGVFPDLLFHTSKEDGRNDIVDFTIQSSVQSSNTSVVRDTVNGSCDSH